MPAIGTIIFTILVPGTVTIVVPHLILTSEHRLLAIKLGAVRFFGWIPLVAGVLIYLWTARDFTVSGKGTPAPIAAPRTLVVRGLYRYLRNPMYVGVLSVVIGEALLFESVALFIYALLLFPAFHMFVVFYEERVLRRQFGASYQHYCESVSRWVPSFRTKNSSAA